MSCDWVPTVNIINALLLPVAVSGRFNSIWILNEWNFPVSHTCQAKPNREITQHDIGIVSMRMPSAKWWRHRYRGVWGITYRRRLQPGFAPFLPLRPPPSPPRDNMVRFCRPGFFIKVLSPGIHKPFTAWQMYKIQFMQAEPIMHAFWVHCECGLFKLSLYFLCPALRIL